jgi:hypothetical protein
VRAPRAASLPRRGGSCIAICLPMAGAGITQMDEWPTHPFALLRPVGDNDLTKRLMWSGLIAGIGALATIAANRVATTIWRRVFDEDPPD